MTPLSTEFAFRGDTFRQIKRRGRVALYERTKGSHTGYEVIRIKQIPETTWPGGKVTPAHEGYPSDNDFGKIAWYYMANEQDKAEARFRAETRGKE